MRSGDASPSFGPSTGNSPTFTLQGGKYWVAAIGTFNSGTIALQKFGPDGATLVGPTGASFTSAGNAVVDLPPGTYQWTISGSTSASLYAEAVRINEE